ncbi:MAG: hypothetical protein HWN66_12585 [Candidatus Helarchaeota archaeon]|nr:hypothetical protein [Candidatus Helarchaeota archaeon]
MKVDYTRIATSKLAQILILKYYLSNIPIKHLILTSPFLSYLEDKMIILNEICRKEVGKSIHTYFITLEPENDYHNKADPHPFLLMILKHYFFIGLLATITKE